jgi:tRNA U34 5-methylaminomethyl-2-thiouridine-forming methyltransferase MnmC
MFESLNSNGVMVTYCAQGQFRRNLKSLGFMVDSLPGPPGKREMTRGTKI